MTIKINNAHIKKAMFLQGLNSLQLAERVKVSPSYMSQVINGKRNPSAKLAKNISVVLDVDVQDVFEVIIKEESDNVPVTSR